MIFIGDIASPNMQTSKTLLGMLEQQKKIFGKQSLVANLEGLLSKREPEADNEPLLSNDPSLPLAMKEWTEPVFCLANNHVLDFPEAFTDSLEVLENAGIPFVGAGLSPLDASKSITIIEGNHEVILFNACWDFLLYNQRNPSSGVYVEEINEKKLLEAVSRQKESRPEAKIVVYLHWSLDLESLPFPMYRQFSEALIDAGSSLVIGTHSHCIQGGEAYRDGYILYGLGNFFIPDYMFAGGKLSFPAFAKLELALEWDIAKNKIICHWYEYQLKGGRHFLNYLNSDYFEDSDRLEEFSPYRTMSDQVYTKYFKKNRRKKILIPVYRNYQSRFINSCYTSILKARARTAHYFAKLNIIKWQN